jgi:hypothetical protein
MRIVKYSSKEQGPWTSQDSKLVTFDVPLSDDIDHRKSYLIMNMGASVAGGVYNLMFGSPTFNVPYRSCSLVQNSSLKSDMMASPLEYNQDVNLFMTNKKHYETGFTEQNAISYFQKSAHFDSITPQPSSPFLSGVNYAANNAAAVYKTANVIIPLSDVLQSFGDTVLSKKVGNKLTYQFELDKNHKLFTAVSKCQDPINIINVPNFTATAADVRQITSTATYGNKYLTGLKRDNKILVKYTTGGHNLYAVRILTANGVNINANGKLFLETTGGGAAIWADGSAYTNISVSRAEEGVDYVGCADLAVDGNQLTTTENQTPPTNPFFCGQRIKVIYGTNAANNAARINEVYRTITAIDFPAGNKLVVTVDVDVPQSTQIYITSAKILDTDVLSYNINKCDLVLYQGQFGAELPKVFPALEQMPRNKLANSLIDETYLLRPNTLLSYFIQGSSTELVSYDPNLYNYRLYLDNKPTTEQNIVLNGSMSEDIKLRIYGPRLNSLDSTLNTDLNERKLIVEETKGKNMLQITMNAGVNGNMLGNILYMFSIVEKKMDM